MITELIINRLASKTFDNINYSSSFKIDGVRCDDLCINVRIPFCRSQCDFCLFRSNPWNPKLAKSYLQSVKEELEIYSHIFEDIKVRTVYFSGGTPTLMPEGIAEILEQIEQLYDFDGESSIEANPLDLNDKTLSTLIESGIERISIGVQSFNDEILETIGRSHESKIALNAIKRAKDYGFKHINIFLMFALPDQELYDLKHDIKTTVDLEVSSISTYPLILVPYSEIYDSVKGGLTKLPSIKKEHLMYSVIMDFLSDAGYQMSAIWRFSKDSGGYCGPFEFKDFVGIGPSAWSVMDKVFSVNTPSLTDYINSLKSRDLPILKGTVFPIRKAMKIWFLRNLYHTKVFKDEFRRRFNGEIEKELKWFLRTLFIFGLLKDEEGYLKLTKKGLFYASDATKCIAVRLLPSIS
ncbi:MAG: coproporphyrinogen III oxidase family protein [archaeon]|nr:coproporphyrinogen III oxidase family protein [archaeon]